MDGENCREKILSQNYWDFIVPGYGTAADFGITVDDSDCTAEIDYGFSAVYVDSQNRGPLSIERYWYNAIPNCYALLDMAALNEAGITAVQNYPSLQLMGEGMLIGFVDTGIDYRNEIFRNLDGSTRIAGIWDQTIQTDTAPEGLLYGSEYTQEQIDEALRSENPLELVPSTDTDGHGTYLASIAAGSANVKERFLGAAPEASIAAVKLKPAKDYLKEFYGIREEALCFQENDVMMACKYLNNLAVRKNMPLVLCIALGTNFGGHNSASLLSSFLNVFSSIRNRYVVIGGGNEANLRHHYHNILTSLDEKDEVEVRVGSGNVGFAAEFWATVPNVLTLSVTAPSGERTPPITVRQGSRQEYSFTFDRTRIVAEYRLLVQSNNSQLIFLKFTGPSEGIWKIVVEPLQLADGEFHIWLPIQEFLSGEVYFLEPDPNTTITEPSSTANGITVAYYNGADNSIDINSGRGYTRNRFIKPDFAAPGVGVTGAGLNGRFVSRTGSSIAVGITAGAVALLAEWVLARQGYRSISTSEIRSMLLLGADQKPFLTYPNREWGYGTLDLYQTLERLSRL